MKTTITITNLFDARKNKKLMRVLYSLTLRGFSEMRYHMHSVDGEYAKYTNIILAKSNGRVVGWALMYHISTEKPIITECRKLTNVDGWFTHFYVSRAFRRKGIGTILYNTAKELCGDKIYCSSWDKISTCFFNRTKAKIYGEPWQETILSNPADIYLG